MDKLKAIVARWCLGIDAIIDRLTAGGVQMDLPLEPAADAYEIPARYQQNAAIGDNARDGDELTTKQERRMARRLAKLAASKPTPAPTVGVARGSFFQTFHAPETARFTRPLTDPAESLERAVKEGRAMRKKLRETLAVPEEVRLAGYVEAQAWVAAERARYAAKKKGAAA